MEYQTYFNLNCEKFAQSLCAKSYGQLTYQQAEAVNDAVASEFFTLLDNGLI
jgi:hypothetical protein